MFLFFPSTVKYSTCKNGCEYKYNYDIQTNNILNEFRQIFFNHLILQLKMDRI